MKPTTIYLVTTTSKKGKDIVEGAYLNCETAEDLQYTLSMGIIESEVQSIDCPKELEETLSNTTYIDILPLISDYLNKNTEYTIENT